MKILIVFICVLNMSSVFAKEKCSLVNKINVSSGYINAYMVDGRILSIDNNLNEITDDNHLAKQNLVISAASNNKEVCFDESKSSIVQDISVKY